MSAWKQVLLCPSMVAALMVSRHGPASRSAAFRKIAALSSKLSAFHAGAADSAVSTASATSAAVASCIVPSTVCRRCGGSTSIASPPPIGRRVPSAIVRSACSPAISFSRISSRERSRLPGANPSGGTFVGLGTVVTASIASTPASAFAGLNADSPILARAVGQSGPRSAQEMITTGERESPAPRTTATRGHQDHRPRTARRRRRYRPPRPVGRQQRHRRRHWDRQRGHK